MKINELKKLIVDKKFSNNFSIFLCNENYFLANQYINKISQDNNLMINKINSLSEIANSSVSLVLDFKNSLNVLFTDEFNEVIEDYSSFENTIVVCSSISNQVKKNVEDYIIEFPKLTDWQIKDYIKIYCKGIDEDSIDWLYSVTKGNIYRIINELDKINLFSLKEKQKIINELRFDKYTDLYYQTEFNICEAIVKKDLMTIVEYLKHKEVTKLDEFYLISLLINKFKQILFVNYNSGVSLEQLNLSQKQANAIRYYYKNCSESYILSSLEYLTSIDKKIKSGKLDVDNLLEVIICHILNF